MIDQEITLLQHHNKTISLFSLNFDIYIYIIIIYFYRELFLIFYKNKLFLNCQATSLIFKEEKNNTDRDRDFFFSQIR